MELPAVDGLLLRAPDAADVPRWLELAEDPAELRWARPVFAPPVSAESLGERIVDLQAAALARLPTVYVIAYADDPDRFLGAAQWRVETHPGKRIADIGYGVHPDARRRGVATGAIRALSAWLLSDDGPGIERVQLDHSTENPASCRAALAAGFEQEGVRRSVLPLRDPDTGVVRRHDVCLHGLVPPGA